MTQPIRLASVLVPLVVGIVSAVAADKSGGFGTEPEPSGLKRVVAVTNVCAWPNLTLLRDGTLIAVLHDQPAHGTREGDVACWATRDGLEWEKRGTITKHAPHTVRMNHAAGQARNGDLVVLCSGWTDVKQPERPKQQSFRDAVLSPWVMRSNDGGRNWSKDEAFPKAEAGWTEYIPFGDIWIGQDGALHTSCYQGRYVDATKSFQMNGWRSLHFFSRDDGRTWERGAVIGARHNETAIFPLGGGSWLAAARIERMELIRSDDHGRSWGEPVGVTDRNEINGHLARLRDGRLLLSYGVRVAGRRGVCAKLSEDDGRTWGAPLRIAHAIGNADCGYPASSQLPDGAIVTAWYAKESTEHSGYHMGASIWRAPGK